MYYLLVILIPLAMIIIFGYASIFTELWLSTIAPWLLACVVNNLILSTYVNWLIFIPSVEYGRYSIKKLKALEGEDQTEEIESHKVSAIETPLLDDQV